MKNSFFSSRRLPVVLLALVLLFGIDKVVFASSRSDLDQGGTTTNTDALLILRGSMDSVLGGAD